MFFQCAYIDIIRIRSKFFGLITYTIIRNFFYVTFADFTNVDDTNILRAYW